MKEKEGVREKKRKKDRKKNPVVLCMFVNRAIDA